MKSEPWPLDRSWEFGRLQELIRELNDVNKGSNALERMERAIQLAEMLSREDFTTPRKSFLSFLEEKATGR